MLQCTYNTYFCLTKIVIFFFSSFSEEIASHPTVPRSSSFQPKRLKNVECDPMNAKLHL